MEFRRLATSNSLCSNEKDTTSIGETRYAGTSEGGARLGGGGVCRKERLLQPRGTGSERTPADQRRLPGAGVGPRQRPSAAFAEPDHVGQAELFHEKHLGRGDTFDKATAALSIAYADQTERDYELLKKAARKGELEVVMERW